MVAALLDARAEPNIRGCRGRTPLHMAAYTGRIDIAKQLLEAEADLACQCNDGRTALQEAKSKRRAAVMQLISEALSTGLRLKGPRQDAAPSKLEIPDTAEHMMVEGQLSDCQTETEYMTTEGQLSDCQTETESITTDGQLSDCATTTDGVAASRSEVSVQVLALRHAFIVTNSNYAAPEWTDLYQTTEPGRKLKRALLRSGFNVTLLEDVGVDDFWKSLKEMEIRLGAYPKAEQLVFFYFAGHGLEENGELQIIMVGAARVALSEVIHRLLQVGSRVAVVAVPDCCRVEPFEGVECLGEGKSGAFGFKTESRVQEDPNVQKDEVADATSSNFYILYACDPGTCIMDSVEDSLGYQIASTLMASPGSALDLILKRASEQVKVHRMAVGQLQRPWSQCGAFQMGKRVLRPVLCNRCEKYRKRGAGEQCQGLLTAEGFSKILGNCQDFESCALAALNALEAHFMAEPDDQQKWAPLSAFYCSAIRADACSVLQFMTHLHPELVKLHGFDAFDYANYFNRGTPSASALRRTPVLAVAAGIVEDPLVPSNALIFLLEAKADVNARDVEGWTAYQHACYFGNAVALECLLPVCHPDSQFCCLTPLQVAAAQGHENCLKLLLESGADVDEAIPSGWTLDAEDTMPRIPHADSKVWYQRIILQRLGPANLRKFLGGVTAIHLATASGSSGCVGALLRARAVPNPYSQSGLSPLQLCIKRWNMPHTMAGGAQRFKHSTCGKMDFSGVFDALLEAGVRDSDNSLPQGAKMETALHALAFHWGKFCPQQTRNIGIRLIEEAKSLIDAPGPSGGTPLHFAVNGRNWAMCELLLDRRADPSLQNDASRCVWELPILKEGGQWPNANVEECCSKLLSLRPQSGWGLIFVCILENSGISLKKLRHNMA